MVAPSGRDGEGEFLRSRERTVGHVGERETIDKQAHKRTEQTDADKTGDVGVSIHPDNNQCENHRAVRSPDAPAVLDSDRHL